MMTYIIYYFILSIVLMALAALWFAIEDLVSYIKESDKKSHPLFQAKYNYGTELPFTLFMIALLLPFLNIFGFWFWAGVLKLMIKDKIEDYKVKVKV